MRYIAARSLPPMRAATSPAAPGRRTAIWILSQNALAEAKRAAGKAPGGMVEPAVRAYLAALTASDLIAMLTERAPWAVERQDNRPRH